MTTVHDAVDMMAGIRASHVVHDDTVMVTLEIPANQVVVQNTNGDLSVTMEGTVWHDAAKRVLRQQSIADHELDIDAIAERSLRELRRALARGTDSVAEPDVQRRRAVANVLTKLSDLVLSGIVQEIDVSWVREVAVVDVEFGVGSPGRRRHRVEGLRIAVPPSAKSTTRSSDGGQP